MIQPIRIAIVSDYNEYLVSLFFKSMEFRIWTLNKYRWSRCPTGLSCYAKYHEY